MSRGTLLKKITAHCFFVGVSLILISACDKQAEDTESSFQVRPLNVPNTAIWRGSEKGGSWGHCSAMDPTQVTCDFYSQNGDVKKAAIYRLCVRKQFDTESFKSPLGASPHWLDNGGGGWIETKHIQFIPTGELEVFDWNESNNSWDLNRARTQRMSDSFTELFQANCLGSLSYQP